MISFIKKIIALRRSIKKWHEINYQIGIDLGYPECCVKAFCVDSPEMLQARPIIPSDTVRYKASFIGNYYTGFIPCAKHAKQITEGKITLVSLIKNRKEEFPPFPEV